MYWYTDIYVSIIEAGCWAYVYVTASQNFNLYMARDILGCCCCNLATSDLFKMVIRQMRAGWLQLLLKCWMHDKNKTRVVIAVYQDRINASDTKLTTKQMPSKLTDGLFNNLNSICRFIPKLPMWCQQICVWSFVKRNRSVISHDLLCLTIWIQDSIATVDKN